MMPVFRLRTPLLFLALASLAACAPAKGPSPLEQPVAYGRTPGETLRYRVMTESQPKAGPKSVSDARVAIRFAAGDTAHAWIESLRLAMPGYPDEVAGGTFSICRSC